MSDPSPAASEVKKKRRRRKKVKKEEGPTPEELQQQQWDQLSDDERFHRGCSEGLTERLHDLLFGGYTIPPTKKGQDSPLHMVARAGAAAIVDLLVIFKCDMNYKNRNGDTPLHTACYWGKKDVAERLILHGARTDLKNGKGLTALDVAKARHKLDVERLFAGELVLANKGLSHLDESVCGSSVWNDIAPFHLRLAKTIDLRNNDLHYLPTMLASMEKLTDVQFSGNPMTLLPPALADPGVPWSRIKAHLQEMEDRLCSFQRCHKLVVVGPMGGGKTKLIEGLCNPKGVTDVEEYYSTKGLDEITDMRLIHNTGMLGRKTWEGECSFTVWEFAGNPELQAQFMPFMRSESVFVVVFDLQLHERDALDQVDYWMNTIHATQSPLTEPKVIIVATHFDRLKCSLEEADDMLAQFKIRYSQAPTNYGESIVGLFVVSLRTGMHMLELKKALDRLLRGRVEMKATAAWIRTFDYLKTQRHRGIVTMSTIREWSLRAGVASDAIEPMVSYFERAGKLAVINDDVVVLHPFKMAEAVGCFVNLRSAPWKREPHCGRIEQWESKLGQIFIPAHSYQPELRVKWLEILQYLGLCVIDLSESVVFVPWYFRATRPEAQWLVAPPPTHVQVTREYRNHFLSQAVVSRVIAEAIRVSLKKRGSVTVTSCWRRGIVMREVTTANEGHQHVAVLSIAAVSLSRAHVSQGNQDQAHRRALRLEYQVPREHLDSTLQDFIATGRKLDHLERQILLVDIVRAVDDMLSWSFPRLHSEVLRVVPCSVCYAMGRYSYFDLPELEASANRRPDTTIQCSLCEEKSKGDAEPMPIASLAPDAAVAGRKIERNPVFDRLVPVAH